MTILASAMAVLRCFSADCPALSVTEVGQRLGMPKSTASRLLKAMREAGFLEQMGDSKRYRPGEALLEVGYAYRAASTLIAAADDVVGRIVERVGHTGYLSIRDGGEVTGITYRLGHHALRVATPLGHRLPAAASATGRSLLARLADADVSALFPGPLAPPSATAPQSVPELLERLARVRALGYAESHDEANPGVGAIAVAVGSPESGEAVSLCIAYPIATVTPPERDLIITELLAGARRVATLVGDPVWLARAA